RAGGNRRAAVDAGPSRRDVAAVEENSRGSCLRRIGIARQGVGPDGDERSAPGDETEAARVEEVDQRNRSCGRAGWNLRPADGRIDGERRLRSGEWLDPVELHGEPVAQDDARSADVAAQIRRAHGERGGGAAGTRSAAER